MTCNPSNIILYFYLLIFFFVIVIVVSTGIRTRIQYPVFDSFWFIKVKAMKEIQILGGLVSYQRIKNRKRVSGFWFFILLDVRPKDFPGISCWNEAYFLIWCEFCRFKLREYWFLFKNIIYPDHFAFKSYGFGWVVFSPTRLMFRLFGHKRRNSKMVPTPWCNIWNRKLNLDLHFSSSPFNCWIETHPEYVIHLRILSCCNSCFR